MFRSYYAYDDMFGDVLGRGYPHYDFDGDVNRASFAPVSQRAYKALDQAKEIFLKHLATVDTSNGPVTREIIEFHLVPDMKKAFAKFVKEYDCVATSRKITREEQDKIAKTRKSLMQFTSVKVTPAAQKAYLEKNPNRAPVAGGSAAASTSGPLKDNTTSSRLKRTANDAQLDNGAASGLKAESVSKKKAKA